MNDIEIISFGIAGGLVHNMLNLYKEIKLDKKQRCKKDFLYWIFFMFWPLAGGLINYLYITDGCILKAWPAFTTGLTAPTFLQALISKTSKNVVVEGPGQLEE